jgi:pantothenate kinase
VAFVKALKEADKVLVTAPSFDHAFKDPVYDAIEIRPQHRIVVIEGLYALLSIDPWKAAAELVDERVYLKVDIDTAKKRYELKKVHRPHVGQCMVAY